MMTAWGTMIAEARTLPPEELRRHAHVSIDNRHRCETCFTCACAYVFRRQRTDQEASTRVHR